MSKFLWVGLGGGLGACLRYLISLLPWKGSFPLLTFVTNLAGAVLIGLVVGLATAKKDLSSDLVLFLKTGLCGGFTTFSTFCLETLTLMESGKTAVAACYAFLSFAGCVLGVWAGKKLLA